MDPVEPPQLQHGSRDAVDVTSWVSVCPRGPWRVHKIRVHRKQSQTVCNSEEWSSCFCPRLGSVCQIRVKLKPNTDEPECSESKRGNDKLSVKGEQPADELTETATTPFTRRQDSVLQVPLGEWTTLRLGEGQCDITEACLEGMRAGEKCEILLTPFENEPEDSVPHPAQQNQHLSATVELHAYTPGKDSWEMSPGEKWEWVKSHKERGGARFRSGDVWGAGDSYSRALKLLITLYRHVTKTEDPREADACDEPPCEFVPSAVEYRTTKAELHSNMSLCQLKLKQPDRAKANAAQATELDPGGTKAWYRLGQACQMLNELEEAKRAFRRVLELQPESPAALKALNDVASKEKETNAKLGLRLSKMFM